MRIDNKEEFEQFYPYKDKTNINYPEKYPCLCYWEEEGGGLTGYYKQIYVLYLPEDLTPREEEVFLMGLRACYKRL